MSDVARWWAAIPEAGWTAVAVSLSIRLAIALAVFLIGVRVVRWIVGIAAKGLTRAAVEPTAVLFLHKVAYVTLMIVLVLAVLQGVFGVAPTSMVAVLGAAGLAIGLALKDSLSNVASGVMLVSLQPFRVGDIVTIAGETGQVESVSIFQTRLRGPDNQTIVLPNSLVTGDSIINLTPDTMRRIELVIGIGYNDDIEVARAAALAVMHTDGRVLAAPAPDVLVYALADNAVNLGIRCHVANADHFVTKCELTERIKKAFDATGVSIPFPQREVHVVHRVAGADSAGPYKLVNDKSSLGSAKVSVDDPEHHPRTDPE